MLRIALIATTFLIYASSILGNDAEPEQDTWFSFVPGNFALVGRNPDDGTAYSGTAVIQAKSGHFTLERVIEGKKTYARGTVEVPHPPGEGKVLRFRWSDEKDFEMTCLVSGDLDNYARLSCIWVQTGREHKSPGLEAYFSTHAWTE
jgi:hypothetical protein